MDDNERIALEQARRESRGQGPSGQDGVPPVENKPLSLTLKLSIGVAGLVGALLIGYALDPCLSQRFIWFANGSGIRSCAWEANCKVNRGQIKSLPAGSAYMTWGKKASSACGGVKF